MCFDLVHLDYAKLVSLHAIQVNNDGPGGLQCNGLDVSADGSNVAIAGVFGTE